MSLALNNSKPKIKLIQRARNIVNTTVNLLKPDIFFGIFLFFIILGQFIDKANIGLDIVFSIFIFCYFGERVIKYFKKKNALDI